MEVTAVTGGRGQQAGDALGSIPGANSSPRICGVNDECRARLLLEDLGDPALGTGTRGGRAPAQSYGYESPIPHRSPDPGVRDPSAFLSQPQDSLGPPLLSVPKDPGVQSPPTSGIPHPNPFLRLNQESGSSAPSSLGTRRPSPGVRPPYLLLLWTHHAAAAAATYPAPHIPSTNPDSRPAQDKPDPPLPSRGGARSGGWGGESCGRENERRGKGAVALASRRPRGGQRARKRGPESQRRDKRLREGKGTREKRTGPRKGMSEAGERETEIGAGRRETETQDGMPKVGKGVH